MGSTDEHGAYRALDHSPGAPGSLGFQPGGAETVVVGGRSGQGVRLGVACARFNASVTSRLLEGARRGWREAGVQEGDVILVEVPGAFELPLAARALATSGRVDAVACLGAVIRGETSHYDLVAGECATGCQRVQLDTGVPVAFGVVTTDDLAQALERAGGRHGDKGREAVETALEMHAVLQGLAGVAR